MVSPITAINGAVTTHSQRFTGAAKGYVDDKRFDQMAAELKA